MTQEKWQEIIGLIKDKFEVLDERTEELPDQNIAGAVEIIEFLGPLGKMRLERTDQPLVIGKKTIGSRRIGSDIRVEYIFSDTERVNKFRAYSWSDADNVWVEIEKEKESFFI